MTPTNTKALAKTDRFPLATSAAKNVSPEVLASALDHIARTAQASRSQTRRIRWIEQRALGALRGDPYYADSVDLPKNAGPSTPEKLSRRLAAVEAERDALQRKLQEQALQALTDSTENAELLAERDALRADAERYRWLRNEAWGGNNKRGPHLVEFKPGHLPSAFTELAEEAADAAIDAARAAMKGTQ